MFLKSTLNASGPLPIPFKYSRILWSPTTPWIWAGFMNCCKPLQMQWPAVRIHRSEMIVPPQKWPPRRIRLTIKGISLRSASLPPTIFGFRAVQSWLVTTMGAGSLVIEVSFILRICVIWLGYFCKPQILERVSEINMISWFLLATHRKFAPDYIAIMTIERLVRWT